MRLKGDPGYYADTVTIPDPETGIDEQFRVRELDDVELSAYDDRVVEIGRLENEAAELQQQRLYDTTPIVVANQTIDIPRRINEEEGAALRSLGNKLLTKTKSLNTWVCQKGIVSWSLTHETEAGIIGPRPVEPGEVEKLPDVFKDLIRKRIIAISTLTEEEAGFLATSRRG